MKLPMLNSPNHKYRVFNIDDEEEAKNLLKEKKISYGQLSKRLTADKEFALFSLNLGVDTYHYLTEDLQRDPEIIKAAIRYYPGAINNAPDISISDRNFVKEVLSINGGLLGNDKLAQYRDDREMVAAAIKNAGISIIFASPALKSNVPFVLQAFKDPQMSKELRIQILEYVHSKFKEICKDGDPLEMLQKHYDSYLFSQKLNSELSSNSKESLKVKI